MDQIAKEGVEIKERKGREIEIKITEKGQELVEVLRAYDEIARRAIKNN